MLQHALPIATKILDADAYRARYIASDASVDSDREIVIPSGISTERLAKNAPFLNSHRYDSIEDILGRIDSAAVEGGRWMQDVTWAVDANPLAALGWKLTLGGFLRAVSIGFTRDHYVLRSSPDWQRTLDTHGIPRDTRAEIVTTRCTQLELSAVVIGANANAVLAAQKSGAIDGDDLASIGISSAQDLDTLETCAQALDNPAASAAVKSLIGSHLARLAMPAPMRRCGHSSSKSNGTHTPPNAAPSGHAAKAHPDRDSFLAQLDALTR